jgi:hypothetical protein
MNMALYNHDDLRSAQLPCIRTLLVAIEPTIIAFLELGSSMHFKTFDDTLSYLTCSLPVRIVECLQMCRNKVSSYNFNHCLRGEISSLCRYNIHNRQHSSQC